MKLKQDVLDGKKKAGDGFRGTTAGFRTKVLMFSALAALAGGCGSPENQDTLPVVPLHSVRPDGGPDSIALEKRTGILRRLALPDVPSLECNESGMARPKTVTLWDAQFEAVEITQGTCFKVEAAGRTYDIFVDGIKEADTGRREYSLIVGEESGRPYRRAVSTGKYLRLGADATIFLVQDKSKGLAYALLHRQIKASDIALEFKNFEATNTIDSCAQFMAKTGLVLGAIERALGVDMGQCYKTVRYRFEPAYGGGGMGNTGSIGEVVDTVLAPGYLVSGNQCGRTYDSHELQHNARYCVNMRFADDARHIFWNATEAEIMKEMGDQAGAGIMLSILKSWVDSVTQDPSILMKQDAHNRCTALKTFYLSKRYLSLPDGGRRDLVRKLHEMLGADARMLAETTEQDGLNEIACSLGDDPECASTLKKNCP